MSMTDDNSVDDDAADDEIGSTPADQRGRPGQISITDRTSNYDDEAEAGEVDHYECPFCEFTHANERIVRLHITRLNDSDHRNRNAFLDNLFIQAVDEDGNVVKDVEAPRGTDFEGEDKTDLLPERVDPDSRKGEILLEALKRPNASQKAIARAVYDKDDPSASYVHKVLKEYERRPDGDEADEEADAQRGYADLTDLQQEIIDVAVERVIETDHVDTLEDLTLTRVSEDLGEDRGTLQTVSQTLRNYRHVFDHRLARKRAKEDLSGSASAVPTTETEAETLQVPQTDQLSDAVENLRESVEDSREEHEQQLEVVVDRLDDLESRIDDGTGEAEPEGVTLEPAQWAAIVRCCTSADRLENDELLAELLQQI